MHMMLMAGIVLFIYFFSLALICLYRDKLNIKAFNCIFVITDIIFFFCWNYSYFQRGWLDEKFMTLDNISPMIFTMVGLLYFMSDGVREHCLSAIAFLSFGMFCAMLISPEQAYLFNFTQEATFMYTSEAFCHMHASLFGLYLVVTRQIKVDFEHWIKSIVFMYSVITFGVILNYVFHRSFFGMNPYGSYGIYFLDIFGSFGATLIAYYLGVLAVLTIGWQIGRMFVRLTAHKTKEISIGKLLTPNEDKDDLSAENEEFYQGQTLDTASAQTDIAVAKKTEEK